MTSENIMEESLEDRTREVTKTKKFTNKTREFYEWSKKYVNYKIGLMGAIGAGSIACYSNYKHGFVPSALAFGKQAVFALCVGGYNSRVCEKMARKYKSKTLSLAVATFVPTVQTGLALYIYHKCLLTPEAFKTALNISIINLPAFLIMGYYFRRNHEKGIKGKFQ